MIYFFFSSRRRHTRFDCDWSSDVCSSDLAGTSSSPGKQPPVRSTPERESANMSVAVATELTDAQLVHRCRAGDSRAWDVLVERFSRYVSAICVQGFRLREHDAEDVFQEVFTRVYDRLDTLRDDAAVRPWIAQLTRRLCLDRLAAGSREEPFEEVAFAGAEETLAELDEALDRKSTRLNSSHSQISYAVFCLKKKLQT